MQPQSRHNVSYRAGYIQEEGPLGSDLAHIAHEAAETHPVYRKHDDRENQNGATIVAVEAFSEASNSLMAKVSQHDQEALAAQAEKLRAKVEEVELIRKVVEAMLVHYELVEIPEED